MFLIHYYKTCLQSTEHCIKVSLKLGQLYQSGLLEIFDESANELEHLRKILLKFHHATCSTKLHSCPWDTKYSSFLPKLILCNCVVESSGVWLNVPFHHILTILKFSGLV